MTEVNPVLIKELRSRMRGPRAFILLSIYLAILGLVMLFLYSALITENENNFNAGRDIGKLLFLTIATVALIEVCVLTPALTAGSIVGEKERQTYDLLITSLLTPWQIVWGKLVSALAFMFLLIFASVPLMSLAFLLGGVSAAEVLIAIVGLLTTAIFYAAIGLFWSSVMRSAISATSFALGSIILMLLGIPFFAVIFGIFLDSRMSWRDSLFTLYVGGAFLSAHPFIALGITEAMIADGRGVFFTTSSSFGSTVIIPSPWLAYMLIAGIFSVVLIRISVAQMHLTKERDAPPTPASKTDRS